MEKLLDGGRPLHVHDFEQFIQDTWPNFFMYEKKLIKFGYKLRLVEIMIT